MRAIAPISSLTCRMRRSRTHSRHTFSLPFFPHSVSSLRKQGPITTASNCCAKAVEQRLSTHLTRPRDELRSRGGSQRSRGRRCGTCADKPTSSRGVVSARVIPHLSSPRYQRAQGMPGARCARSLVCKNRKTYELVTTVTPVSPGIPRANGFNGFLRALPGDRAFLSPSSAMF